MPPTFKSEFVRLKEIFLKCKVLVLEEPFFALCILSLSIGYQNSLYWVNWVLFDPGWSGGNRSPQPEPNWGGSEVTPAVAFQATLVCSQSMSVKFSLAFSVIFLCPMEGNFLNFIMSHWCFPKFEHFLQYYLFFVLTLFCFNRIS